MQNPERLDSVSGLSKKVKENFIQRLKEEQNNAKIIANLYEYGIGPKIAMRIYEEYREQSLHVIKTKPNKLIRKIRGMSFLLADKLAMQSGIPVDSPYRIRAAIIHVLKDNSSSTGDTYMIKERCLTEVTNLLSKENNSKNINFLELAAEELDNLVNYEDVYILGNKVFNFSTFHQEKGIRDNIKRILSHPFNHGLSDEDIQKEIEKVEEQLEVSYDEIQKEAIKTALTSRFFILTGGPGTGKTTVINGIIRAYRNIHSIEITDSDEGSPILLAAPTGRASRRMNELTKLPAKTLHKRLELSVSDDGEEEDDFEGLDYLDGDLIVVDEFSMVDTWLANKLFSAISRESQLILVGDSDQLPSVGPGQVLYDLLKVPSIPKVQLQKIFRQSADSTIVTLASEMRQGIVSDELTAKRPDRSYLEVTKEVIPSVVTKVVQSALSSGISAHDIQLLAPMYNGEAGINNLNQLLQNLLNPKKDGQLEFRYGNTVYREGDRVIHLVNNPESNVFNGDVGLIVDLISAEHSDDKEDTLVIQFDGSLIHLPRSKWEDISLSYAMSIHKSQGSEFKVVLMPLTMQAYIMLQRNLIYTGVTRAKSKLVLLGERKAFEKAIKTPGSARKTYLVERFEKKGGYNGEI